MPPRDFAFRAKSLRGQLKKQRQVRVGQGRNKPTLTFQFPNSLDYLLQKVFFLVFWLATEEQLSTLPVAQVNTHTQHDFHDLNKCWVLDNPHVNQYLLLLTFTMNLTYFLPYLLINTWSTSKEYWLSPRFSPLRPSSNVDLSCSELNTDLGRP